MALGAINAGEQKCFQGAGKTEEFSWNFGAGKVTMFGVSPACDVG